MDEARVTITLNKAHFVHLLYWVIIIVLAVLLFKAWTGDCEPGNTVDTTATEQPAAAAPPPADPVPDPVPAEPEETCSDGEKNQDETDVDCGGSCDGCSSGDACDTPDDCIANYCTDGACTSTAPVELSGEVELDITGVEFEENEGETGLKVTEVRYSIDNGLEDDLGTVELKVFVSSDVDGNYCLNQPDGEERDCVLPYATFSISGPDSGKKRTGSLDLSGKYAGFGGSYLMNLGSSSLYEHGDKFRVYAYLYEDSGEQIDGESISGYRVITP